MPRISGVREQRQQPRYDVLVRDDGTVTVQSRTVLFGNSNLGTLSKTNMEVAGQLASDNSYTILAVRNYLSLEDGTLYSQVERGLYFTLEVARKTQMQAPIWYAGAGGGLTGYDSTASTHHITLGVPSHEAILKLSRSITLPPRQHFSWIYDWYTMASSGEDARSSLNADTSSKTIMAMIDGIETRDVL